MDYTRMARDLGLSAPLVFSPLSPLSLPGISASPHQASCPGLQGRAQERGFSDPANPSVDGLRVPTTKLWIFNSQQTDPIPPLLRDPGHEVRKDGSRASLSPVDGAAAVSAAPSQSRFIFPISRDLCDSRASVPLEGALKEGSVFHKKGN